MRKYPRQDRSRLTVEAILEAGAQVFSRWGYERSSTEQIVRRAGVSIGSLYQYFSTKETLLIWVVKRQASKNVAEITALLDQARLDGTPTQRVIRQAIELTVLNHMRFGRVQNEARSRLPGFRNTIHEELRPILKPAIEATARLFGSDDDVKVADPHLAATFVVETLHERAHWYVEQGRTQGLEFETFTDELELLLVRYLRGYPAS